MASTNVNSSWEKIQRGVKDTERLIGQKEYNAAMVKARQTLEFMVRLLAERACIVDGGDLMETIDALYQNRWIGKTTCEHYHKIRIIGNKAAHEGDNNAYNANQAYHMLSQEVYTFANDYRNAQRGTRPGKTSGSRPANRPAPSGRSQAQAQAPNTRSRKRTPQKKSGFTIYDLLKLLIPILCIVLLVLIIKLVKPAKDDADPTSSAPTSTEELQEPSAEPTEPPETTAAPAVTYKTTDVLNVRPAPNTTDARIGQLEAGVTVDYVRAHDSDWAVIMYNGQEAYVASRYLTSE